MFEELDNDFQKFQQNINQKYNSLTKDNELKDKKISSLKVSKKKLKKQVKELEDKVNELNKKIEFQKILEQKLENSENEFDRLFNKHVQKIEEVVRYKKKIETIEETHLEEIKIMEEETLTERCAFTQNYNHLIGVLQIESQKVRRFNEYLNLIFQNSSNLNDVRFQEQFKKTNSQLLHLKNPNRDATSNWLDSCQVLNMLESSFIINIQEDYKNKFMLTNLSVSILNNYLIVSNSLSHESFYIFPLPIYTSKNQIEDGFNDNGKLVFT